jgi:hypothetical protein
MTEAPARVALHGGGSVLCPARYKPDKLKSEWRGSTTLFRRLHSTMGGYVECDGMITIARRGVFADLDDFAVQTEGAATTRWKYGNLMPGWVGFDGPQFPVIRQNGPCGPERVQKLSVQVIGFFKSPHRLAWRIAIDHPAALLMQVWIFEKQGGLTRACVLADEIAASFVT